MYTNMAVQARNIAEARKDKKISRVTGDELR